MSIVGIEMVGLGRVVSRKKRSAEGVPEGAHPHRYLRTLHRQSTPEGNKKGPRKDTITNFGGGGGVPYTIG